MRVELTHFRSLLKISMLHTYFGGNQAHTLGKKPCHLKVLTIPLLEHLKTEN